MDARVSAHEQVCAERWSQIRKTLDEMKVALHSQANLNLTVAGAVIVGFASLLLALVFHK